MTRDRVGRCWDLDLAMCLRELMDTAAETIMNYKGKAEGGGREREGRRALLLRVALPAQVNHSLSKPTIQWHTMAITHCLFHDC